jgi:hypothetical protein
MPFRASETPAAQPAGPAPITTTGERRARGPIGADLTLSHLFSPPNRPMMRLSTATSSELKTVECRGLGYHNPVVPAKLGVVKSVPGC